MYKIFADNTLIYDSTVEDYKINRGSITLETNKSGSFAFSVYPDHFYYNEFVRLKTVITVYKRGKIVFRGRIINDDSDYWNNKNITCEGELGFLQDSIIRPFSFSDTPEKLFKKFINEHNAQVDAFKQFKVGKVTVTDPNNYIARENTAYQSTFENLNSRLLDSELGGYLYITHGTDGTEEIPTINYLVDFETVSSQKIEFGSNLKNYAKKVSAADIATAIIPIGATIETEGEEVEEGEEFTEKPKLNINEVNGGKDYVYDAKAVEQYGWIFKTVEWSDVTDANTLKKKAEEHLHTLKNLNITVELTAIDLALLDRSIESFGVNEYISVITEPHGFNDVLLCQKQTLDLLKPENDTITLGHTYSSFTERASKLSPTITKLSSVEKTISKVNAKVSNASNTVKQIEQQLGGVSAGLGVKTVTLTKYSNEITWVTSNKGMLYATLGTIDSLGIVDRNIVGCYISDWLGMDATGLIVPYIQDGFIRIMATAATYPDRLSIAITYQ